MPSAAASSRVRLAGLANTLALGTWVVSAMVPAYFSDRMVRRSRHDVGAVGADEGVEHHFGSGFQPFANRNVLVEHA